MNDDRNYIGYAKLERLIEIHDSDKPVYVLVSMMNASDDGAIGTMTWFLNVQDLDPYGNVRYWRSLVGQIQTINGQPWRKEDEKREWDRANSALEIVQTFLQSHGLTIHEAVVAFPKHLRLLKGTTDIMKYDRASDRYHANGGN